VLAFAPIIGEWFIAGAINGSSAAVTRAMKTPVTVHHAGAQPAAVLLRRAEPAKGWTPYSQLQRLGLTGASAPLSTSKNLQQDLAYFILWLVCFALFLLA